MNGHTHVAPSVTIADLEAEIVSEHYFTAAQGDAKAVEDAAMATGARDTTGRSTPAVLGQLTFCVLVLRNGFTVTGESACVSAANFDAAKGRTYAREKAVNALWPLLGFRLRDRLASQPTSH